ncbi:Hypothetical protein HDN1F_24520 [gamma proteobacterium HdN1]|nr:Hypothetical protein HDN1F_24520 [gamma proteobacterium HdN1]
MSEDKRKHVRTKLFVQFKLLHPALGERTISTRDISDEGVYLILENPGGVLPVGARVQGQAQGVEGAPVMEMEVVRVDAAGLGLRFVTPEHVGP